MLTMLARRRVALGFLVGAVALIAAEPTWPSLAAGGGAALLGEGIRVWASGHLEKGREVTQSGPYRWMRHPLYVGSALMGLGFAVASNRLLPGALTLTYLLATIGAAVRIEERALSARFGGEYERYRRGERLNVARRFSLKRAIRTNREYRAVAGLAAVAALLMWRASR